MISKKSAMAFIHTMLTCLNKIITNNHFIITNNYQ